MSRKLAALLQKLKTSSVIDRAQSTKKVWDSGFLLIIDAVNFLYSSSKFWWPYRGK